MGWDKVGECSFLFNPYYVFDIGDYSIAILQKQSILQAEHDM